MIRAARVFLSRSVLGLVLVTVLTLAAFAHGAWLGGGGIGLLPQSKQDIQDNMAAGRPPLSIGDTISVIADFPVITAGTLDGPGGYATLYVPPGTEVVGAFITDAAGTPVDARPARASTGSGVSKGWGPKGQQTFDISVNGWNPSETMQCQAAGYSTADCNAGLAYTYGDTGIFYSTRSDTALFADGSPVADLTNGYLVNPTNGTPWSSVGGSGTARVHNKWDAVQVNAFGSGGTIDPNGFSTAEETTITGGRGATPFRGGSPVAGPESGSDWDRYGTTGPWNRIQYNGSCRADDPLLAGPDGPATGAGSVYPEALDPGVNTVEVCSPTTEGYDLNSSQATALPAGTNAVRFAFGGIAQGETYYAVLQVRVTDLDALGYFNAEGHGGDSAEGAAAGNDNPWRYWVAGSSSVSPAGPDDLYVDISISAVNGAPYTGGNIPQGAKVTYRVNYVNVSLGAMTDVATQVTLPPEVTGTDNFRVLTGPDIRPSVNPSAGTFAFQTIPTLNGLRSGAIEFDAYLSSSDGGTITASTAISSAEGGNDTDSVTANVTAVPVDTMPVCTGERFSVVDWASDAPLAMGTSTNTLRYGIDVTVSATSNAAPLRPANIATQNQLYASNYGGSPVLATQYATIDVALGTPVSAVQFYVTSLDLDESVTIHGERAGQRVQPAISDGPLSAAMVRQANADGSVLGERNGSLSVAGLAENFAVLVGFSDPVDRIVITHDTRQNNSASFAGAMQLTDIQACADFADAPSALGNAVHTLDPRDSIYLGAGVESDPGPGDASDAGSDDDDGVDIPPLIQGFLATVEATVIGQEGNLTAWMDFDGNSVFDAGTAEVIAVDLKDDGSGADVAAGDGVIQFEVTVPGDAVLSQTFARFRWSTAPGLGVADLAPDGEVEDYPINIGAAPLVDRGDAPATYGDPLHIIADVDVAGTYLGAVPPDPEAASQASADASGDDLDGNDDEDGATIPQLFAGGTSEITVVVNEVTGGLSGVTGAIAYLQAWLDFDGNGTFDGADQIASNLQDGSALDKDGSLNGVIKFDVSVPSTATQLPTFVRFRWSTTEGVVPVMLDGEVEDYQVTISGDDPPITCDKGLYQITGRPSSLRKMIFSDNGNGFSLDFQTLGSTGTNVDAGWGYNQLDGYIYGVRIKKGELWRIDGSGTFVEMPNFPNSAADGTDAGDILSNGVMIYKIDANSWQLLDISDPSNPVDLGVLNLTQAVDVADFAANPVDGFLYGVDADTQQVFRVSSNGGLPGTVPVITFGPAIYNGTYGAIFFDEDGRMYAYEDGSNALYLIDTATGNRQLLATSAFDEGGDNDGTSCRGPAPVPFKGFGGNVFIDQNASDVKDAGEFNLGGGIQIDLYSDNGTPNDLGDDVFVTTTDTAADGTYRFEGLPSASTYRVEVNEADPDLPPGSQIGTSNPLVGVTPDSSVVAVARNFGFDPQSSDLSITKVAYRAGTTAAVTTASPGDLIDWVVEVTNSGPGSPSGVTVSELIPSGFEYVSDDAPGTGDYYDPSTGVWFVDEILSGATETLTVRVRVQDTGDHTNIVEITKSSLPDIDSDPSAGILVDDFRDGLADDDEASVTITLLTGSRRLSGQVLHDNGTGGGIAHDGDLSGAEIGTDKARVLLLDATGALLASPEVSADGSWFYLLDAAYTGEITVSIDPDENWIAISESAAARPGLVNSDPRDGSFAFTPAAATDYSGLDLGIIALPTLSEDRTASIGAGQVAVLPHVYRAASAGSVAFAYADVIQNPDGAFSFGLFRDTDCDSVPDAPLTAPVPVVDGDEICLVSRVSAGAGAGPGSGLSYDLTALTTFNDTSVTALAKNRDRLNAESGGGQLVLVKFVRNVTRGTAEGQSNKGAPGDVLEYRILLVNPSQARATDIIIYDHTPPYTQLAGPVPSPVSVSPALDCTLERPSPNVAGYSGPLRWACAGFHAPGDEGAVSFQVQISP